MSNNKLGGYILKYNFSNFLHRRPQSTKSILPWNIPVKIFTNTAVCRNEARREFYFLKTKNYLINGHVYSRPVRSKKKLNCHWSVINKHFEVVRCRSESRFADIVDTNITALLLFRLDSSFKSGVYPNEYIKVKKKIIKNNLFTNCS